MKKVLEIGCGQGFHAHLLAKKNKVIGIDISEQDIAISQKRYPEVQFLVMDSSKLAFTDETFDEVYALDVLEHVNSLGVVLGEIRRVLKPQGRLVADVPYAQSEAWLARLRPSYFQEIHHERVFGEKELETLLEGKMQLVQKKRKGFLQHVELFFLFKFKGKSETQLGIGNWRDNFFTKILHVAVLFFDPMILKTVLVFFPLWIITLPIGFLINSLGNIFFPKTLSYQFKKT